MRLIVFQMSMVTLSNTILDAKHIADQLSKVKGIIIRRFRKKAHNVKAHGI